MTARVAVLGLGTMGGGMAHRLLDKGFELDVWNRTPAAAAELAGSGATAYDAATDSVAAADVVITTLPDSAALDAVMLSDGVLRAMQPESILVQMGTIGLDATDRMAATVARERPDVSFVDAPVSGSRQPARTGHLIVFASGPDSAKATVAPVFDALGERTMWLGPAGAGSKMKLVANALLAFEVEAMAEASALAARLGIPYSTLADFLNGSPLASSFELLKLAKMESGDDSPDFSLELALKDVDLALAAAGTDTLPVAASIAQRWHTLVDEGHGRLDVSAVHIGLAV